MTKEDEIVCPKCGYHNLPTRSICKNCGEALVAWAKSYYEVRINPYPTTRDVASGLVWLFFIGGLLILPFILFFSAKMPLFVFLIWLFPIILLSVLRQEFFDKFVALINRGRFSENSLVAEARVLDKIMEEMYESRVAYWYIDIGFVADSIKKGRYSQQLKVEIPQELYNRIEKGQTVVIHYSRLNPRLAILADEENYVPEKIGREERVAGIIATIIFVLPGIVMVNFVDELAVKIFGGSMALIGCLIFYFLVYNP